MTANENEQIERILLKMIKMLKVNLKENFENTLKLIRTFNKIENRLQIIEKQNANQSTKAGTYANVMKIITKTIKNNNETNNNVKKMSTINMIAAKKEKKLTIKIKNNVENARLRTVIDIDSLKKIERITKNIKNEAIDLR